MSYIIGSDFYKWLKIFGVATGGGPPPSGALLAVNNLSDVLNDTTSFENLGLGRPGIQIVTDADFAAGGGTFTLTNPPPIFVVMDATSAGRVLKLPPQNQPTSLQGSQNIRLLTSPTSFPINIHNGADTLIFQVAPKSAWEAIPNDRTSVAGAWEFLGIVMTINGNKTGDVDLASDPQIRYVAPSGSDVPAENDGSILFPYKTLGYALSQITPSPTSFFEINMAPAQYTETDLVLKQNVFINGNQSALTVTGTVSLDVEWVQGGYLYIQNFMNLSLPATVTLDFNLLEAPFALLNISNNIIGSNTTLNIIGKSDNGAITILGNNFGFSSEIIYNITNCYGAVSGGASGDISIINTSDTAGGNFSITDMTSIGNVLATTSSAAGMTLFHSGSLVAGTALYQSTGPGVLTVFVRGLKYQNTPTLDNGTGGGSVAFSADRLGALPNLLNGATYTPSSIGDAVRANLYFTPSNYTPQAGPPGEWIADSVTGNLKGIDEALAGGGVGIPTAYAESFFQANATPTPFAGANTPTKVLATYNSGDLQQFTQVGGTFTYTGVPARELNITATLTATYAATAQNTSFYITKNGAPIAKSKQSAFIGAITPSPQPLPVQAKIAAVTGDTFELWVENNDNTNAITVYDLNFGISSLDTAVANIGLLPSYGEMFFQDNVTPTPISAPNTPVKITATYGADELKDFSHVNGTLTYNSTVSKVFTVKAVLSATYAATAQNTSFYIAVNGVVVARSKQKAFIGPVTPENVGHATQALVALNLGNTVEVWIENNDNANDPIVTDFNFIVEAMDAIGTSPNTADLSEVIFVDGITGSDLNTGNINSPLKTYDAARLLANSRNPQYGSGQTIVITTTINASGDMIISPFVSVVGFGKYTTIMGISGNFVLDPLWGTTGSGETILSGIAFIGQSINFVYPAFQDESIIRFENCSLQLLNAGPTATFTGSNGSGDGRCETVIFNNCTQDLGLGLPEPQFISDNVNVFLLNSSVSNLIQASVSSATVQAQLIVQDALGSTGDISVTATSTGTLVTTISGSDTSGKTLTVDGTSNTVKIDASSYQFGSIVFSGGANYVNIIGGATSTLYIDANSGDDNNSGTINYPMKTYEAARLKAVASASTSQVWTIFVIGNHTITGDMTLSANVNIEGINPYNSGFNVSNNVIIDSNWGASDLVYTQVRNMYLYVGGNYIFTFTNPQAFNFLKFVNVAMNTEGFITITGSADPGGFRETVIFENCTNDLLDYADGFAAENVDLFLINTDITAGSVTMTASTAASVNYNLIINNARFYTNDITVITTNTSTLTTRINACNTMSRTLTIDGANNTVYVDSTSYMFTLALTDGATLANLILPTKTDGMTNSSYVPANYTPTGDTLYGPDTLTGNLKGIDEALPQVIINGMTASGFVGVSSVTVLGSHEVKVGNIVVGSLKLLFTSTGSVVNIHAGKSFGNAFSQLEQAIGSGICAKSLTTSIGDASVQIVQAVLFASELEITMDVNGADDYKAEINFTYEVI